MHCLDALLGRGIEVKWCLGGITIALCHHRTYEEEASENEAVAEEEEEGEEDVFTEKVSPEAEECPALKVKRDSLRRSFIYVWAVRKGSWPQGTALQVGTVLRSGSPCA